MSWPKGRPRPKKVSAEQPAPVVLDEHFKQMAEDAAEAAFKHASAEFEAEYARPQPNLPPADWRKGALLNVRTHHGHAPYVITLWPEEYDREHPERSISFTNGGECQDWVSKWYAAEHHDPRAR